MSQPTRTPAGAPPFDAGPLPVAPTKTGVNTVVVPSASQRDLALLLGLMRDLLNDLHALLASAGEQNQKVARTLGVIKTLQAFTQLIADRDTNTTGTAPTAALAAAAAALNKAANDKIQAVGSPPFARALDDTLNGRVKDATRLLVNVLIQPDQKLSGMIDDAPAAIKSAYQAIWDRAPQDIVQAFSKDETLTPAIRLDGLHIFETWHAQCYEEIAKTERMDDLCLSAPDSSANPGKPGTLAHVVIEEANKVRAKVLGDAAGGGAAATAGAVGRDGLSLTVLKVYALKWLLQASVDKASAKQFSGFLLDHLVAAMGLASGQKETLRQKYIRLANKQADLVHAQHAESLLIAQGPDGASRVAAKTQAREQAQEGVETEVDGLKGFLNEHLKGAQDDGAMNGALAVFAVLQIAGAWQALKDAGDDTLAKVQNAAAIGASGVQFLPNMWKAATPLIKKFDIRLGKSVISELTIGDALGKFASRAVPILNILSGGAQILDGVFGGDTVKREPVVLGGATVSSGVCLYAVAAYGAESEGAFWVLAATGAGDILAIGVGAYIAIQAIREALTAATGKVVEQLIDGMRSDKASNQSWTGRTYVDVLGLTAQLGRVKEAASAVSFFPIPWNDQDGSREGLVAKVQALGFNRGVADAIIETDDLHTARASGPSIPPGL